MFAKVVDADTISLITEKEKKLTGKDKPVPGGPAAHIQKHAGEDLTSEVIREIAWAERKVTGGKLIKGGPTATAQTIAAKVKV